MTGELHRAKLFNFDRRLLTIKLNALLGSRWLSRLHSFKAGLYRKLPFLLHEKVLFKKSVQQHYLSVPLDSSNQPFLAVATL